ncbi:ABC transporter permease [Streptosporangium sp. NPDC004631]
MASTPPVAAVSQTAPEGGSDQARTAIHGRSRGQLALARLRRDKVTLTALVVCAVLLLVAAVSPMLSQWGVIDPLRNNPHLVTEVGSLPNGPAGGMSWQHWMGVEPGTGRDLLSRIVAGLTISLTVAVLASLLTVVMGTCLGIIAGISKGKTDWAISRLMDIVLSFPQLLMLLSLAPILVGVMHQRLHLPEGTPSQIGFMVLVLGCFGWPQIARIVRGQVLSLREQEFIEAARSLGARRAQLYFKEILPHLWAPILVYVTLVMPQYIAAEATLGFLGVGIQAPTPSLGSLLNDSVTYAVVDPAYFIFPGATLAVVVLAFNLLGDGLRDVLDPKGGTRA